MKVTGLTILLVGVFFSAATSAAPVTSDAAANVVRKWLLLDPAPLAEKMNGAVKTVDTFNDATGEPLYYVVHVSDGFVVVASDDTVEPIVAFVPRGQFSLSSRNALGALVGKDLPSRLRHARAHPNGARAVKARQKWQKFNQPVTSPPTGANASYASISAPWIAPFIQTQWDQQTVGDYGSVSCYNYYTPPNGNGNPDNYPCGCVATALAQLMYYFQYPTAAVGTGSFNIIINGSNSTANLLGGDGAGGAYAWSGMPAILQNPSSAQCQAIGALTHDAGVAVNMDYEADGSGATISGARSALARTFLYKNAIVGGQDSPNTSLSAGLLGMINPNLDARQPVILGIWTGSQSGHCVICDGYGYSASTLYHHINMGWSGYDNAWYALPEIDTTDGYDFTNISSCIYNVSVAGSGEIISGRVVDDNGAPIPNAGVNASRLPSGSYTANTDANGIYALVGLPSASSYTVSVTHSGYSSSVTTYSTGTSRNNNLTTGNVWAANVVLEPTGPPVIFTSPANVSGLIGRSAALSVSASGLGNMSYQWFENGIPLQDGANVTGSATDSLLIGSLVASNAGSYFVTVSDSYGSVTSSSATVTAQTVGTNQLAVNGGFESGSFSPGWIASGNDADCGVQRVSPYVYSGSYGAQLGPFGSLGYLTQNLPTTAGSSYLLSCWLNSPDGEVPNQFLVSWNGISLFNQTDLGQTGWTNLQFVVTATGSNTALLFGFRNDDSYFGLDAITVNPLTSILTAPRFAPTMQVSNGVPFLQLTGLSGQGTVVVLRSTDLAHWTPIYTNTSANGSIDFSDPAATNYSQHYYRAVIQSP